MPQFPSSFPSKRESITTFDFTDIASGVGLETFFLIKGTDSVGTKNILTPLPLTSTIVVTPDDGNINIDNETITINFETSVFNLPRTVKGNAYANFKFTDTAGGAGDFFSVQFVKVLTDLSTVNISSEIISGAIITMTESFRLIEIPLTQTGIKKGEKIRAIVKLTEGGSGILTFFHTGADSKVLIPFRIDNT